MQSRKWQKRIKFSDFLKENGAEDNSGAYDDSMVKGRSRVQRQPYTKSSRTVYERFQSLLSKKSRRTDENGSLQPATGEGMEGHESEPSVEGEADVVDGADRRCASMERGRSVFEEDEMVREEDIFSEEIHDGETDEGENYTPTVCHNYQWFFESGSDVERGKSKFTQKVLINAISRHTKIVI